MSQPVTHVSTPGTSGAIQIQNQPVSTVIGTPRPAQPVRLQQLQGGIIRLVNPGTPQNQFVLRNVGSVGSTIRLANAQPGQTIRLATKQDGVVFAGQNAQLSAATGQPNMGQIRVVSLGGQQVSALPMQTINRQSAPVLLQQQQKAGESSQPQPVVIVSQNSAIASSQTQNISTISQQQLQQLLQRQINAQQNNAGASVQRQQQVIVQGPQGAQILIQQPIQQQQQQQNIATSNVQIAMRPTTPQQNQVKIMPQATSSQATNAMFVNASQNSIQVTSSPAIKPALTPPPSQPTIRTIQPNAVRQTPQSTLESRKLAIQNIPAHIQKMTVALQQIIRTANTPENQPKIREIQRKIDALRNYHQQQVQKQQNMGETAGTASASTSVQSIIKTNTTALGQKVIHTGGKQIVLPPNTQLKPGSTLVIK